MKLRIWAMGFVTLGAWAQAPEFEANVNTEKKPWTHLEFKNDARNFQFAIVTDRTGGHRDGIFESGVARLNLMQPEFVVSVGDLIEGYTEDREELGRQWDEFMSFTARLEMPFFYVPGNHDITNAVMAEEWDKRFGRPYYHFVYGDVLFLCLNSEDPPQSQMSDEQVEYVAQALADNRDVRWTMVFLHKPLWTYNPEENGWAKVERLLEGRPHNVYAGHTHNYQKYTRNDSSYIVMATMGGGTELRGANFGEFDHFMWVTMTDQGPIMANLMLDGIWDTNVLHEGRMDLLRPIVAGAAVKTEGVVIDTPAFAKASTTLRLTNDADIPMEVNVSIRPTEHVMPSITHVAKTVAPNSVELVPLELTATGDVSAYDLEPIRAMWTVNYVIEGELNPLHIRGSHRIIVDTAYPIAKSKGAITLDGKLDEWGALPVNPLEPGQLRDDKEAWLGNHDGSFEFGVVYDADKLIVGVDVTDDRLQLNRRRDHRRQDALLIAIDPSGGQSSDEGILIPIIPDEGREDAELPEGVEVAFTRTEGGYQAEMALPLSQLSALQKGEWRAVRVNIGLNDVDPDGAAQLWWRPEWGTPADYAGSGVFRKN